MPAEFWGALFGLIGSAIGSIVGIVANTRLHTYRLEQLEKKVDKHNNLIERTYELEKQTAVLKNRIDDIEKGE